MRGFSGWTPASEASYLRRSLNKLINNIDLRWALLPQDFRRFLLEFGYAKLDESGNGILSIDINTAYKEFEIYGDVFPSITFDSKI